MSELEKTRRELEEYDSDVREGRLLPDPAYRRALILRIDMLREEEHKVRVFVNSKAR
jgi:hypothetical protein